MSHHSVNYDPNKERVDLLTKQQLQHQEATSTQQTNAPSPKPPTSSQTQISVGPLVQVIIIGIYTENYIAQFS